LRADLVLGIELNQKLIKRKLIRPTDSQPRKRKRKLLEETSKNIEKTKRSKKERKRIR
jgi:hypothetical protein